MVAAAGRRRGSYRRFSPADILCDDHSSGQPWRGSDRHPACSDGRSRCAANQGTTQHQILDRGRFRVIGSLGLCRFARRRAGQLARGRLVALRGGARLRYRLRRRRPALAGARFMANDLVGTGSGLSGYDHPNDRLGAPAPSRSNIQRVGCFRISWRREHVPWLHCVVSRIGHRPDGASEPGAAGAAGNDDLLGRDAAARTNRLAHRGWRLRNHRLRPAGRKIEEPAP